MILVSLFVSNLERERERDLIYYDEHWLVFYFKDRCRIFYTEVLSDWAGLQQKLLKLQQP